MYCQCVSFVLFEKEGFKTKCWLSEYITDTRQVGELRSCCINSTLLLFSTSSLVNRKIASKAKQRKREQYPPPVQEGPWKIRLIWRSFKEHQALQLRRGASEQVKGERLRLHRCEVGALTLSLVLFINLFHPWRASPDPHSSQRQVVAFLPLLILLHHTTCTYLNQVSSGTTKVREPQAQTFSLSFTFTVGGKRYTRPLSFYIHFKKHHPSHAQFLSAFKQRAFISAQKTV